MYDPILVYVDQFITLEPAEVDFFTSLLGYKMLRKRQYAVLASDVCKFDSFAVKGCLRTYFVDERGAKTWYNLPLKTGERSIY